MSPQNRPRSNADRYSLRPPMHCHARAATLDQLHDFSLPDAVNVELWLDRIDARRDREVRS
jgi:hypothetical protein